METQQHLPQVLMKPLPYPLPQHPKEPLVGMNKSLGKLQMELLL